MLEGFSKTVNFSKIFSLKVFQNLNPNGDKKFHNHEA